MTKVSEHIIRDHRELEADKDRIFNASSDDEQIRWRNQFTWELARHSIAEELVVYPAMEKHVPNGREMADKDRAEHLRVKELLYKFQSMKPKQPDFLPTLQELWAVLSEHIKEEEEYDLVKLEQNLTAEQSASLTTSFERTKLFVPTRSHPSAPDKPPFETVAGLLSAPLDHLIDLFSKFPKEKLGGMPP